MPGGGGGEGNVELGVGGSLVDVTFCRVLFQDFCLCAQMWDLMVEVCDLLQCVAVCCFVLRCVAVCCSVLQ